MLIQSCPTLYNPIDCSPPGSSVHRVFQARMLEWVAVSYPMDRYRFNSSELASLVAQTVKSLPAMQKTQVQSLGQEDTMEKGMATHSSILAWRIPWTGKPDRLQSMGLRRAGHDWATNTDSESELFLWCVPGVVLDLSHLIFTAILWVIPNLLVSSVT